MRALLLVIAAVRVAAADPRTEAQIRSILETQRARLHIPGLAYAIIRDDQIVAIDAIGFKDVEKQAAVTTDTVFPIGSCTKSFTAMTVAIANDDHKLSLDDSPRRFLPYFKMADPEANELVTLRDMLSHRTGLKAYADLAAEPDVLSREDYLRAAIGAKPQIKLRAGYQYSNAMMTAAGEAVARAYGMTWEKVVETKIFGPLKMTGSNTRSDKLATLPDAALGYVWTGKAWKLTPAPASLHAMSPAGGIVSSAKDMARWVRLVAGSGMLEDTRLVAEATFRELQTPHVSINSTLWYGLGWALYDWKGHRVMEHNGGALGISAIVSAMPDRKTGFVILANTSPSELTKIGAIAAQLYPVILGERGAPPPAAPSRTTAPAAPQLQTTDLPKLDELLAKMVAAAGGETNQRAHTSMRLVATGRYEQQGVDVELVTTAAETKRVDDESWTAAGKKIGRVRVIFDGVHPSQQTTFGQDDDPEDVARAARDATLHPLLELQKVFDRVSVEGRTSVVDDDQVVLLCVPRTGEPVRLYVSTRTGLVVRKDTGAESTTYSDFRSVDGEVVPFQWTVHDSLGDKVMKVKEVRWKVATPDGTFAKLPAFKR